MHRQGIAGKQCCRHALTYPDAASTRIIVPVKNHQEKGGITSCSSRGIIAVLP